MEIKLKKQLLPNGEVMAYRESGQGDRILILIHGNQSSSVFYEDFMTTLNKDIKVYAIDLIGFGDSSYKNKHRKIKDWSDDIYAFLEVMDIDSAVVAGWSLGGSIAMELAADYPEKVEHLLIMAATSLKGYPLYETENFKPILDRPIYKREDIKDEPLLMMPVLQAFEEENREFFKLAFENTMFNLTNPGRFLFNEYITATLKERCFLDVSVALAQFNITDEKSVVEGSGKVNQISMPVTWVHGRKDLVVPVDVAKDNIDYFKGEKELIIMENAGHAMFVDSPDQFREIVEDIFKKS